MNDFEYIARLPKIELHVHLESTIDGEKLERYAERQGKKLPRKGRDIYNLATDDLSNFLAFLDFICSMVGNASELEEIAYDFSVNSHKENIIYAETILNPTHWPQFSVVEIIDALTSGFDRGALNGGCDCRFTLSLSRSQSLGEAMKLVRIMKENRTPRLVGLSIDGNEKLTGRTGEKFAPAFLMAHEAKFGITVHAGESSGPEGVIDALDFLHTDRLDHGVRSAEDSELVERLRLKALALNVCLTSNLALLYRDEKAHPLRKLWDAGVKITLSRDDPTFLNLTLTEELRRCAVFANFTKNDLIKAQFNAVDAAFCNESDKNMLRGVLDAYRNLECK